MTGTVELPERDEAPALNWADETNTELDDVLLLLSLFTRRRVFTLEAGAKGPIIADPRYFDCGWDPSAKSFEGLRPAHPSDEWSVDLSKGVSDANRLIRSDEWQRRFHRGHFLFLFLAACHHQILESSFMLCWTIWEHLFRLHNESWLSATAVRKLDVREKLAFMLTEYRLRLNLDEKDRNVIARFARIRHLIVHDGRLENGDDARAAQVFIGLTECVVARTLDLTPSKVFSWDERYSGLRDTT